MARGSSGNRGLVVVAAGSGNRRNVGFGGGNGKGGGVRGGRDVRDVGDLLELFERRRYRLIGKKLRSGGGGGGGIGRWGNGDGSLSQRGLGVNSGTNGGSIRGAVVGHLQRSIGLVLGSVLQLKWGGGGGRGNV